MKRKYYMRGLGIGVIATCLIFMTALLAMGYPMSDSAVKRRARQLGMVEASGDATDNNSRTLKEIEEENKEDTRTSKTTKTTKTTKTNTTKTTTTTKQLKPGEKPDDGREKSDNEREESDREYKDSGKVSKGSNTAGDATKKDKTSDNVTIHIAGGDSSATVGSKLQSAGLVTSGSDFDRYLEKNGYDTHIHAGSFSIAKGSDYAAIAKKITG